MKIKILLFLAFFTICVNCFSQEANNWSAFYQKLDATAFQGLQFRFTGMVRVDKTSAKTHATLWARVDKLNNTMGFFDNMHDRPINAASWKKYKIEGSIDDSAKWLLIGGIFYDNGGFHFDDMLLEIKNKEGKWQPQQIENAGFEKGLIEPWKFFNNPNTFSDIIKTEGSYSGKDHLGIIRNDVITTETYGNNDNAGHYIKANGIKIYYEEYGSGDPLLLLHGNSQSIESFRLQIKEFSKYFRVIAVDTRGHGKTSDQSKRYTYDLFADDMLALIDKLNLDKTNIVGWSDGGNTALIMALKKPEKINKIVTMGAVVFIDTTVVSQGIFDTVNAMIKELKNTTSYSAKQQLRKTTLLLEEPHHSFAELHAIKNPVLVMAGEHDLIKPGHTKGIADNIPGAVLDIVPGQTHYLPQENATLFNEKVLNFLRSGN